MPHPRHLPRRLCIALATSAMAIAAGAVAVTVAAPPVAAAPCNGYVGLTYDDGPNPGTTTALLNALTSAGARATFFNMGQRVQQNPALARAQQTAGMWVANHSWSHPHMTQMSAAQMTSELSQTQQAIQQATGTTPRLFRPPYGETNATLRQVQSQLGLTEVLWNVDSQDWNGASTSQIVQAASTLQNGGVILMHDGYQTTINAVPQIVANLNSRGLCPGMISPSTGRAVAPDGTQPTVPPTNPTNPPTNPPNPPTQGPGGCSASVSLNSWTGGFVATVRVTAGSSGTNGWTVSMTLPSGATITNSWNSQRSGTSGAVTFTNVAFNGRIAAGQSTEFGFQGSGSGTGMTPSCRAT